MTFLVPAAVVAVLLLGGFLILGTVRLVEMVAVITISLMVAWMVRLFRQPGPGVRDDEGQRHGRGRGGSGLM